MSIEMERVNRVRANLQKGENQLLEAGHYPKILGSLIAAIDLIDEMHTEYIVLRDSEAGYARAEILRREQP